jgi:hypothetical protein
MKQNPAQLDDLDGFDSRVEAVTALPKEPYDGSQLTPRNLASLYEYLKPNATKAKPAG